MSVKIADTIINMVYNSIVKGKFISRPNRFIAYAEINGKEEICHVKNTGRCRELLIPGADIILEKSDNPNRKTKFDLVSVYKNGRLINMDSQAPNKIAAELLPKLFPHYIIKSEQKYKNSRFDFYMESENTKAFVEVKGVTLEKDNIVMFPDAPTERGVKHINELIYAVENSYDAYILFIIQLNGVKYLTPNYKTHHEFGETLKLAEQKGVKILAYDCIVKENEITADKPVMVFTENQSNF